MRILRASLLVLVFTVALRAHATDTIFFTASGITCNTSTIAGESGMMVGSWSLGTTGSTGTTKPGFQPLVINRPFDECSPLLLEQYFRGTLFPTITITQYGLNKGANTALMVITLTNARFATFDIGGTASADPLENWGVIFTKVCIKNVSNNAQACYDYSRGVAS